jgi:hypothetical protein
MGTIEPGNGTRYFVESNDIPGTVRCVRRLRKRGVRVMSRKLEEVSATIPAAREQEAGGGIRNYPRRESKVASGDEENVLLGYEEGDSESGIGEAVRLQRMQRGRGD